VTAEQSRPFDACIPTWTREADRALGSAMREARFLGAVTPQGGRTVAEVVASFEAGDARSPEWTYAPLDPARATAVAVALEAIADALTQREPSPLANAYATRARELAVEGLLSSEAGTPSFATRARERFVPESGSEASALAEAWVSAEEPEPACDCTSDGDEPSSLASRLREEIGKHRLPFRVVVSASLAPLAATGDRVILVAAGRAIAHVDVERTVLHEVEGHVRPRLRASTLSPGLFAIGTAGGADDQEGLALTLEERHGFLVGARRRELAWRHRAVLAMDDGATFVDTVRTLVARDGAPLTRAVAAAARAFRGSAGETPGLGRERVYLAAFVRVASHLHARPADEAVLASGQVAVDAIDALSAHAR
jgi:hypothetical protein